ncbi:MAG: hypothetical protein AB7K63_13340 [Vicinamibacterales bacterium]
MRVLFFVDSLSRMSHLERLLQSLAERGHTVVIATARPSHRSLTLPKALTLANHALAERGLPGRIELTACPSHRIDRWAGAAPALRQARDHLRYRDPRLARAGKYERRAAAHAPTGWLPFLERHPWVSSQWRLAQRLLALAERAIPSERLFDLWLTYEQPDVVVVTPLVSFGSYQTDYVKSARRIGVPVVFLPSSWDSLTNHGLVHVEPERVLVWNEALKQEAVELHGIASSRIVVTGAWRFDDFIAARPVMTREQFCAAAGLDSTRPYLLYLCSSEFVAPREVEFVPRWIEQLRASADVAVRSCGVLVRPHPGFLKQWRNADLSRFPHVAVWADSEALSGDQGLRDSLAHAAAAVGINTGAMIEAAIAGTPVLTLLTGEFAGGQSDAPHFRHLRSTSGGPLREAASFDSHAAHVAQALQGGNDAAGMRAFVERFVRPRGIDAPATPLVVNAIEEAAHLGTRPRRVGRAAPASIPADETLVLTATFRPGNTPTVAIHREDERIEQYLCALVSWAGTRRVRRLVFAENSNTRFDFSPVISHLEAAGKQVEVLVFDGNTQAAQFGKGFGEGAILEHVFRHSRLLQQGDSFYKITGRLFVRNFDRVSEATPQPDAFRLKERRIGKASKANTVFFKCSRDLFESRLLRSYRQVDEPNSISIEHVYFNQLRGLDIGDFGVAPVMVGRQASTGMQYEPYDEAAVSVARALLQRSLSSQAS